MKITEATVKIEHLDIAGEGIGIAGNREAHIWNALTGETVLMRIYKKQRGKFFGVAENIIEASPHRQQPREDHFLSCSPWSIMDFAEENRLKRELVIGLWRKMNLAASAPEIIFDAMETGYRNKMEFSFTEADGRIELAFFERGRHWRRPISSCELATLAIRKTAKQIITWLNSRPRDVNKLKSVIIRSNSRNETLAAIFVKNEEWPSGDGPKLDASFLGFALYFSNPQSPAAVPTKLLFQIGKETLTETVLGTSLSFGVLNFFQVNVAIFEQALRAIEPWVSKEEVVDLYAGVGTISLALQSKIKSSHLVEIDAVAVLLAKKNIVANGISTMTAEAGLAEKCLATIAADKVLIVDPPRSGLHPEVIKKIMEVRPKRLVYLSCNPTSQAKDLAAISSCYIIAASRLFNFFPRTPHIESLCVLNRKD